MKKDSSGVEDNCNFETLSKNRISNFSQEHDAISIFADSIADSIDKEIESLMDCIHITIHNNLTENEVEFDDLIDEEAKIELPFGPKIEFEKINHDNSFDSLEYDLCFELKSEIFQSVLNAEEKKEIDNTGEVDSANFHNSKNFTKKLPYDSPQLPKNLNVRESPFIFKFDDTKTQNPNNSGIVTDKITGKNTLRSNNCYNDSFKKNAFCCSSKLKTKLTNNSIFSNILFTKKSTNISLKSLRLNDSLSRWRKKRNLTLNKSEETNYSRKEKVNCMCLIF